MYNPSDPESIKRLVKDQIKDMIKTGEIEFKLESETYGSKGVYNTEIMFNILVDDEKITGVTINFDTN